MTTDELERDLEKLAEPREADERLRRAIRAQLRWRISLGTVRRPGGRWRLWGRGVRRG
jgi:hypothetical protein